MIDRETALAIFGLSSSASHENDPEAVRCAYWAVRAHIEERLEGSRSEVFAAQRRAELRELDAAFQLLVGHPAPGAVAAQRGPRFGGRMNPWLAGWALASTLLALLLVWTRPDGPAAPPVRIDAPSLPEAAGGQGAVPADDEPRAWLTARANRPGARLEITRQADGRVVAEGPADDTRYALLAGDYALRVVHPDCPDEWHRELSLAAGESAELEPRNCLQSGFLVVRSNVTGDRLAIDGRNVGATGPAEHPLTVGEHRVRVEKEGYSPWQGVVEIEPAERLELRAELSPQARAQEEAAKKRESAAQDVSTAPFDVSALREARRGPTAHSWHERVKQWLLSRYDADRSGRLDSSEEVRSIPCDEWLGLEQSHDASGLALSLTRFYGFDGTFWVEDALGFDESMRGHAYARMKECGLH